jgi:hypothetical protein
VNAQSQDAEAAAPVTPRRVPVWLSWTVTIAFAVLFTYPLWVGIGSAVNYPQMVWDSYHLGITPIGWALLVVGVLAAPLVFVCCLLLGRSRGVIARALIYAAGTASSTSSGRPLGCSIPRNEGSGHCRHPLQC